MRRTPSFNPFLQRPGRRAASRPSRRRGTRGRPVTRDPIYLCYYYRYDGYYDYDYYCYYYYY